MYHVSAQGADERMINVHYYNYVESHASAKRRVGCTQHTRGVEIGVEKLDSGDQITFVILMAEYGCTISLPLSVSYFVQLYVPLIVAAAVLVLLAVFRGLVVTGRPSDTLSVCLFVLGVCLSLSLSLSLSVSLSLGSVNLLFPQ